MLGAMVGRQLPLFSVIVPFWLIWAFAGFRAAKEIWPAALICGLTFGVSQFAISNYISPSLAAIGAALICLFCLRGFLLCLATEDHLDVRGAALGRSFALHHAAAKAAGGEGNHRRSVAGVAAADPSLRHPGDLGYAAGKGVPG